MTDDRKTNRRTTRIPETSRGATLQPSWWVRASPLRYSRQRQQALKWSKPTSRSRLLTELATPHSFIPKPVPIREC